MAFTNTSPNTIPPGDLISFSGNESAIGKGTGMDPILLSLLLSGGLGFAGSLFSGQQEAKQTREDREASRNLSIAEFLSGLFQNEQGDRLARSELGLQSTQLDPFTSANSRFSADLKRQFAGGARPISFGGGGDRLDASSISPEALDEAARLFYLQVAGANPFVPTGGGDEVESFRQRTLSDTDARRNRTRQEVLAALNLGQNRNKTRTGRITNPVSIGRAQPRLSPQSDAIRSFLQT